MLKNKKHGDQLMAIKYEHTQPLWLSTRDVEI